MLCSSTARPAQAEKGKRGCKAAVEDFRTQHGITEERNPVDRLPASGVFWRKLR